MAAIQQMMVAGSSGPLHPARAISGLKLWYNPASGLYQTAGGAPATVYPDPVGQMLDQGPLEAHALQATSGNRPHVSPQPAANGKNVLVWIAANSNWMASAASLAHGIGTGDFWLVTFAMVGSGGGYRCLFSNGTAAPGFYINSLKPCMYWGGTTTDFNAALTADTYHIIEFMRTGSTIKCFVDGVQRATTVTDATSMANDIARTGSDLDGTFSNLYQGMILLYNRTPTAPERASLINVLGALYGVTVTL